MKLSLSLLFLCSAQVFAQTTSPASKVPSFTLKVEKRAAGKSVLHAEPPKGHHINIQAPIACTNSDRKPVKKISASQGDVSFLMDAMKAPCTVELYLCDDANTYCIKKTTRIDSFEELPVIAPPQGAEPGKSSPRQELPNPANQLHGFLLNDPSKAFALAKKERKPVLIQFFGIWCPPCNLLDAKVFSDPRFKELAKDVVKLKLDADSPASWPLKAKYKVSGYPTVVFADSTGKELGRFEDFRPLEDFSRALSGISGSGKFPEMDAAKENEADALIEAANKLEKEEKGEEARKVFSKAAELLKQQIEKEPASDRGFLERALSVDLAYCLYRSGDNAAAEALYAKMETLYPQEFTYYFNHARMLNYAGRYADAEAKAKQAYPYSYGDNRLRTVDALAAALLAQKKTEEAKKLLDQTIRATRLPKDPGIRTHRYMKKLKELRASISNAATSTR